MEPLKRLAELANVDLPPMNDADALLTIWHFFDGFESEWLDTRNGPALLEWCGTKKGLVESRVAQVVTAFWHEGNLDKLDQAWVLLAQIYAEVVE